MKLDLLLDILQLWTVVVKETGRGKSEVDAKPQGSTCFSFLFFFSSVRSSLHNHTLATHLTQQLSLFLFAYTVLQTPYLTAKAVEVGPTFLKSNITSDHLKPVKHNA